MSFLQVASWNVEHLSGDKRGDKAQSPYALADHIELAGIDILALQEIYVTDPAEEVRLTKEGKPFGPVIPSHAESERRNAELDVVCHLLEEHLGQKWRYLILPNRDETDTSQLCAVMWNSGRTRCTQVMKIAVDHHDDGDALWDRTPHALKFTSSVEAWRQDENGAWASRTEEKSIALIPLHMKSNWGGGPKNPRIRAKEARTLASQLDKVRTELDESLVLIGDTNVLRKDEACIEALVDSGLVDLNSNDSATYWSRQYGESPFDRAFVAADRAEFRYSRQYVLKSSDLGAHDWLLSDHFMIKISVKIYLDDTDPR